MNLSQETEALAQRVAVAKRLPVDDAIRQALEAFAPSTNILPEPRQPRDLSPAAVAARLARFQEFADELAAMPILDPRPVQEIVDDLNAI